MGDPNEATLAGDYATVNVTIGATATSLYALAASALGALGYSTPSEVLQIALLGQASAGTDRAAVLFGSQTTQIGYLPAGAERVFPVRGDRVYVKRFGAADFQAVLEIFLRKQ